MKAFAGPANGMWIHHRDNDKTNNDLGNLEYVTPKENTIRAFEDGFNGRGEQHHSSKLTVEQVRRIRGLLREGHKSQAEIGRIFGICQATVSDINVGRIWRVEV
jgi:hypothetical protein